MRSGTNLEGPRLVRIAVPCVETRVAIEIIDLCRDVHVYVFSNEWRIALYVSRGMLNRLKQNEVCSLLT